MVRYLESDHQLENAVSQMNLTLAHISALFSLVSTTKLRLKEEQDGRQTIVEVRVFLFHVFLQSRSSLSARIITSWLGAKLHVSMFLPLMSGEICLATKGGVTARNGAVETHLSRLSSGHFGIPSSYRLN